MSTNSCHFSKMNVTLKPTEKGDDLTTASGTSNEKRMATVMVYSKTMAVAPIHTKFHRLAFNRMPTIEDPQTQ